MLLVLSVTIASPLMISPVVAADIPARSEVKLTSSQQSELTLSDLRDVGLCLAQIEQQAKNIYMEVLRKPVPKKASAEIVRPSKIVRLDSSSSKAFLPTRPEWLVFYIGTLEPIMRLLKEEMQDTSSSEYIMTVPRKTKSQFEDLIKEYDKGVIDMDSHITNIYNLIGDKDNNVPIAQEAVSLYNIALDLEKLRVKAFHLVRNADERDGTVEIDLNKLAPKPAEQ